MAERRRLFPGDLLAIPILLLVMVIVSACSPTGTSEPSPSTPSGDLSLSPYAHATPAAGSMFDPDQRLARPPMSDPPTQLELGHYHYYLSCMVCHGDRGQGLTEEWRSVLDPLDQNCWQSKCHAPNHPPEGFEIPRNAPSVIGTGALGAYRTAADLFEYLRVTMPWPFPGLFQDEDYWQLTAFLAEANQVSWGRQPLGPRNAAKLLMIPGLAQSHHSAIEMERVVTGVVLALLVGTVILQRWMQARS